MSAAPIALQRREILPQRLDTSGRVEGTAVEVVDSGHIDEPMRREQRATARIHVRLFTSRLLKDAIAARVARRVLARGIVATLFLQHVNDVRVMRAPGLTRDREGAVEQRRDLRGLQVELAV